MQMMETTGRASSRRRAASNANALFAGLYQQQQQGDEQHRQVQGVQDADQFMLHQHGAQRQHEQTCRQQHIDEEEQKDGGTGAVPFAMRATNEMCDQMALSTSNASLSFREGSSWKLAYQRNNKSKDQKNLRCFPNCCAGFGHQDGFCGQSVTVVFDYAPEAINMSNVMACAEFAVSSTRPSSPGSIISLNKINDHGTPEDAKRMCYMKGHRLPGGKPLRGAGLGGSAEAPAAAGGAASSSATAGNAGTADGKARVLFEFNRNLKGWHYGFLGSKKTRNMYHIFRVYVLERLPSENGEPAKPDDVKYRVLAVCWSPPWQMYCRRRKYNQAVQKKSRRVVGSSASEAAAAERQIQQQLDEEARIKATQAAATGGPGAPGGGTKSYLRRADSAKRLRLTGRSSMSVKRRPDAIDIPSSGRGATTRRRGPASNSTASSAASMGARGRTSNSAAYLDLGNMSLDRELAQGGDRRDFLTTSRSGALLPNLASPSGQHSDLRFERLVSLIKQLDLPQPLAPHKFSLSSSKTDTFAQSVCSFLIHWQQMQSTGPPRLPTRVHEQQMLAGLHDGQAARGDGLTDHERFAVFLLQQESFRKEVLAFTLQHNPRAKPLESYSTSVFALKLFTEQFQDFLIDCEYKKTARINMPGALRFTTAQAALNAAGGRGDDDDIASAWAAEPDLAGQDIFDMSLTPRGAFNQDDFDMLNASLHTPRNVHGHGNFGPGSYATSFHAGLAIPPMTPAMSAVLQHGVGSSASASTAQQQQAQQHHGHMASSSVAASVAASQQLAVHTQGHSLHQSHSHSSRASQSTNAENQQSGANAANCAPKLMRYADSSSKESVTVKTLSSLTPKSSFIFSPKNSFMLSPKHSFTIGKALGADVKAEFDFMNLPSPSVKPPIFAQVDNFLDETKGFEMGGASPSNGMAALKAFMANAKAVGSSSSTSGSASGPAGSSSK